MDMDIHTIERLYHADVRTFGTPDYSAVQAGRLIVADTLGLLLEALASPGERPVNADAGQRGGPRPRPRLHLIQGGAPSWACAA